MSWTLIEHQALTSSAASVTLGSGGTIPQTYKTLKVLVSARTSRTNSNDDILVKFNNSTTSFTGRYVLGNGSNASSGSLTIAYAGNVDAANSTANTFSNLEITIPNYAGSTNKPYSFDSVMEDNITEAYQICYAGLWSNTAAITSLVFASNTSSNFVSGSTFTLYGLA